MNKDNIESIYPLTTTQQGMLFHSTYSQTSNVYVETMHFNLHGALDISTFKHAWQQTIDRHPVLRTFFVWRNRETPLQIVLRQVRSPWQEHDWSHLPTSEQKSRLNALLKTDRAQGFNLSKAPLMRLILVKQSRTDYRFIWSNHHIILDGWSRALLLKEAFANYRATLQGEQVSLEQPRPFKEYVAWLQNADASEAKPYWRERLRGFTTPTSIGTADEPARPQNSTEKYREQQLRLSKVTTEALQLLAHQFQLTQNTLVQGAWALLLSRYSGEADVVFGSAVSGRSIGFSGIESMVGLFINTIPMRVQIPSNTSLITWLNELQVQQIEARKFEHTSLRNIQKWSELSRSKGESLFDSILSFNNFPLGSLMKKAAGDIKICNTYFLEGSHYPLSVLIDPGEELTVRMNYDTHHFSDTTIVQILKHFKTLLKSFAFNPNQPLSAFSLLTAEETQKLLEEFNQTTVSYPIDKTLNQIFEAQIAKTPDNVAVQYGQDYLTYAQLNRRANQIAHYLGQFELGSPGLVCLYLARSCDMIAAILGVLKAGGAYVPLDPIYPPARLALLLVDIAQATSRGKPIVITQPELADNLPLKAVNSVCLGNDQAKISQCLDTNPLPCKTAQDIAYVLYTSGSTGVPKGVCCHHRGVINLLSDFQRRQAIRPGDSCSWWTSISFDVSVYEIFSALLYGAKLYIVPEEIRADRDGFIAWISKHQIQNAYVPPSMVGKLANESERPSFALALRRLLVGVEPIPEPLLATICKNVPGLCIINGYGPTEATICATLYNVPASLAPKRNTPIGRAVQNMQIYLLDPYEQLVPLGVTGEIYIGGIGVAHGYLNRPDLTSERFIADPFNPQTETRLYKTGDMARYLPDGNIQFIGRTDFQIKFRGYRIEPGEIEAALRQHTAVRDTAVIVREDEPNDQRLVGYIVPSENQTVDKHGLRRYLNQKLPPYMVPNVFVLLDALPLTPSDKVDRKGLPKPTTNDTMHGTDDYIAPRSSSEQILAAIWADVFGLSQVSIEANFFDLGGDSIINIQIITRANQAGLNLEPRQLFKNQTIAELAAVADEANPIQTEQGPVTGHVPLTPIQHWFFELSMSDRNYWNQSVIIDILDELDPKLLGQALQQLLTQHDALRLQFLPETPVASTEWKQSINQAVPTIDFEVIDISALPHTEQQQIVDTTISRLEAGHNLEQGKIINAAYFKLALFQPNRLFISIHHLAVDGISWSILLQDIETVYTQLVHGKPMSLPAKTTSIKAWAEKLYEFAQTEDLRQELGYWTAVSNEVTGGIPIDTPAEAANTEMSARTISASLTLEETLSLLKDVPPVYHTQINDVLLTALAQTIAAWTNQTTIFVSLEGHGREEIIKNVDLTRTVGWFTTIFPTKLTLPDRPSPSAALKSVKEQLRCIPNRGIGYGLLRYLCQDEAVMTKLATLPKPQILFNYLGQFDRALPDSELFRLTRPLVGAHSPEALRSYLLVINMMVISGCLRMDWTFSQNIHRHQTIRQLADKYAEALRTLIAHVLSPDEAGGFTPSDFPLANLDENKLSQLSKILKKPE